MKKSFYYLGVFCLLLCSVSSTYVFADPSDTIPPTFDLIEDQTIEAGDIDYDWTTYMMNVADNSGEIVILSEESDLVDYDTPGTYSVTVKATDTNHNETMHSFNVTVVDTTPPTFHPMDDRSIQCGLDDLDWTNFVFYLEDNSDGEITVVETDGVEYDIPGDYLVEVLISDAYGNEVLESFIVTVFDTIPPTINDIGSVWVEAGDIDYDFEALLTTLYDNSNGPITVTLEYDYDLYDVGSFYARFFVSDESGNVAMEGFNVYVVDTTPPTFDEIEDITVEVGTVINPLYTLIENSFDIANGVMTPKVTGYVDFYISGTYYLTASVTDGSGNISEQNFTITVTDTTPPTFDDIDDITIEKDSKSISFLGYIKNLQENSMGELTYSVPVNRVLYSKVGSYQVTVKVEDGAGNSTSKSFMVHVEDTTPPRVDGVINQEVYKRGTSLTIFFNEGNAILNNGEIENGYEITETGLYTLTVTDDYGNVTTLDFEISSSYNYGFMIGGIIAVVVVGSVAVLGFVFLRRK